MQCNDKICIHHFVPKELRNVFRFYEKAFGFSRKFLTSDISYGELLVDETTLSFASLTLANSSLKNGFVECNVNMKPFGFEIGFTTDNVDETVHEALLAGATLVEPSKAKPWGQVVAYIRDPDGFLIEICTPVI